MPGLLDLEGLEVGQAQDFEAVTGLTVVVCPQGAVGGVVFRGGSTSTRQMGALTAGHAVPLIHAVLFTGGSSFGLNAAQGVMECLEARGIGFDVGVTRVPIVPTAALFDLKIGDAFTRPDAAMARQACEAAGREEMAEGSAGAGCGATVGKLFGLEQATKGGLGTASLRTDQGVIVAGLAVVNAFGDVVEPASGRILAGARTSPRSHDFADTEAQIKTGRVRSPWSSQNTTLALVATNARLDRRGCTWLASLAELGLSRTIRPYGTLFDGDLVVALSVGQLEADIHTLGLLAAEALSQAVVRAVTLADGLGLVPDYRSLRG